MNSQHKQVSIAPGDFPALHNFLRAYFHQDMKDEYGSAEGAVREFRSDASDEDVRALAEEWSRFVDRTEGQPLEQVNRILTGPLGSSYAITREELTGISSILKTARK